MNDQWWWYVSRASGIVAWAMLVATLVWGVLLATKLLAPRVRPPWMLDLHRWLGGSTLVLVGVHLAALVADSYVQIGPVDLVVPFVASYEPLALGIGVLALYLLLAVQVSSLAMRRVPTRWWRLIHQSSYLLVVVVTAHAALAGTDVLRGVYLALTILLVAAPTAALAVRWAHGRGRRAALPIAPGATGTPSVPAAAAAGAPTRLPGP